MSTMLELEARKIGELREEYESRGFAVKTDVGPGDLPFDLFGYTPDLVVENGDEHYIIEVRALGTQLPVDRMIEVAREVRACPGWGFLLVTADDVAPEDAPDVDAVLPSWPQVRRRVADAIRLANAAVSPEAALLGLWASLEAVLRKTAIRAALPIERMPEGTLIAHLYSQGELSTQQYDRMMEAFKVRNRVTHGFLAPSADLGRAVRDLTSVLAELLPELVERAA